MANGSREAVGVDAGVGVDVGVGVGAGGDADVGADADADADVVAARRVCRSTFQKSSTGTKLSGPKVEGSRKACCRKKLEVLRCGSSANHRMYLERSDRGIIVRQTYVTRVI